uniref:Uncharacterized protein n=1 Tax=Avena sativa TaxID=4498 RepID=A0ACD5Z4F2_AVESA
MLEMPICTTTPKVFHEDIPTDLLYPTPNEVVDVSAKTKSNEIRIGPITRACAKLLEQQVNSLLNESGVFIDEKFILPKSMHLCMIRFIEEASLAQGGEGMIQEEPSVMIIHGCAREEREAGAWSEENIIEKDARKSEKTGVSGTFHLNSPAYPETRQGGSHLVCQIGSHPDMIRKL